MVPEGWRLQTVGAVFDVQLGKMLNKAAKEKSPQLPYLTNFNVRWGAFDTTTLNTMHFSERDQEKFALKDGDLIMCEGGEVGRCAIWRNAVSPCFYQKALHRLRSKGTIIPEFFQAYMTSIAGTKLLEDYTSRTSIAHLTREKLLELPVKVPPLPEQKEIAQILSTWDQAITATERLLENSQQRKKGLMQQLLSGKKRLPGFEGEWEETPLGNLFAERSEIGVESLPLLSITSADGVVYQDETGRKDTSNADKSKYKRICPGDIGYNTMRMWQGRSSLSDKDGVVSPAYTILAPGEDADSLFFSYLFKLSEMIHVFYRHSQGLVSDTWNLKYNHFRKIVWKVPPKTEQSAIAKILLASDFEINALKVRIDCLNQEKKALMQQLLTGKRRVNVETEAA